MTLRIRTNATSKITSLFLLLAFLSELFAPTVAFALTGGPSQPEVQSFEPVGTTQMVDPFTGDFVYNIPLMDVDGYPLNISYHSGITMEQEASWVGLGWNLNVGSINRGMRGVPDDFNGGTDTIAKTFNIEKNYTVGANIGIGDIEIVGAKFINLSVGFGIFYNNYKGVGYELNTNVALSLGDKGKSGTLGIGLSANSQEGIGVTPQLSLNAAISSKNKNDVSFGLGASASYNSRAGLKAINFSSSVSAGHSETKKNKKEESRLAMGTKRSSSMPVGDQSYIPQITMPMKNSSTTGSFGIGGELFWVAGMATLSGYYNVQQLANKKMIQPAYGYMYSENGQDDNMAMLDFNREKDGVYTTNTPSLPVTNFTYDTYSVTGQGVGGIYRPYRNDNGTVYDHNSQNKSEGLSIGGDVDLGQLFKAGINVGSNFNLSTSGGWRSENGSSAQDDFRFKGKNTDEPQYEPYYFKSAGEMTAIDQKNFKAVGGDNAVRIKVNESGTASPELIKTADAEETSLGATKNKDGRVREKRNQAIGILTADEAQFAAVDKTIKNYILNGGSSTNIPRKDDKIRKGNHISEITTYRTDGARYIYGIPAYNTRQREVTFNVNPNDENNPNIVDCNTGLVSYGGADDTKENGRNLDHYFSATELAPYAHSYLLTAVLSADYVDVTGDGPTDDDFGTYTKFNYTRASDNYKWRIPYQKDQANYNEAFKADEGDDKANYIYGEKEIWYIRSVESKQQIAEFTLSAREDGHGVIDKKGGRSNEANDQSYKLDKISLYAKCDRNLKGPQAVPLQEVNFVYNKDYKLCKNVPNNSVSGHGKLTLEEIYFTYQKSLKGKLSPYHFTYCQKPDPANPGKYIDALELNPDYDMKGNDRWGNYKKNNTDDCTIKKSKFNSEFPYVDQDKTSADTNAAAWSLSEIQLPSGGTIHVNYESDDYAFVQNKRAMQMMTVKAIGPDIGNFITDPGSGSTAVPKLFEGDSPYNYMLFQLPVPVNGKDDFEKKYLMDEKGERIKDLFFRFFVDVIGSQAGLAKNKDSEYEYVSGYAELSNEFGVNGTTEAWIKIKAVKVGDKGDTKNANPIAKTAWQLARINLSNKIYNNSDATTSLSLSIMQSLMGFLADISSMFRGMNVSLRGWDFGKNVVLAKSMVRLYNPNYSKLGGGSRVKDITSSDKWSGMAGTGNGLDATYGQEFIYTKTLEGSNGVTISSGVAEYEPMVGNEENPLRQPLAFTTEHAMAPDDRYYMETPIGETFYPSPSVGYSQVIVRSIKKAGITRTATGYVKNEFYTARDFPVTTEQTIIDKKQNPQSWIFKLLTVDIEDNLTVSQGHVIKLNNMHGKQKAMWVYAEGQDHPISGQEFFYRTDPNDPHKLNNEIDAISKTGVVSKAVVGKELDFVADMRESASQSSGLSVAVEVDVALLPFPPFPFPIPSVWPSTSTENTRFRSAAITKVITSYGILDKVITYDMGSKVSTENLAYDAETGEVLLTKLQNDFDDPVYTFNYPAHWAYDNMGAAYQNLGISVGNISISSEGVATSGIKLANFFVRGDEVISSQNHERFWVKNVDAATNQLTLINRIGKFTTAQSNVSLTIVKSGRKNMQSTSIGSVSFLNDPLAEGSKLAFKNVLNADATVYSDDWKDYCECGVNNGEIEKKNGKLKYVAKGNPFVQGAAGNWKPKRTYANLVARTQSTFNQNTNIRTDGTYTTFDPFWSPPAGGYPYWTDGGSRNYWKWTSEVTKMNPNGFELENQDALENYSSAIYGYANTLPVAVASNSKYQEIGVDNFEDYSTDCANCLNDHWSFKLNADNSNNVSLISAQEAHTGKNSIRVGANKTVSVYKQIVCGPKDPDIPK